MKTQEMLSTHPQRPAVEISGLTQCIEALWDCTVVCTSCADACLGEQMVQNLTRCIRLNLDCADICQATARVLGRQTQFNAQLVRSQLEACVTAYRVCAEECGNHAEMHAHCRICRNACQNCERACQELISRFTA
ncbi:hypothetical protein GMLC_02720 [Geomonas limicola]|uniref:Ferredoxin n=1 Tax=Geomonas limicola TaxID=2740186 RepID=A0A6V8N4Z7_9BACT|nr:four-helix bundle copper-binding protein [Geomonas limicola]GFO66693.1 hypothetical protein GMLC_02720 [Geomonas limicola]